MKNPNALIAMAIVSQNSNNPYTVICEFIKYCIFSSDAETLTFNEIRDAVGKEFGLCIPYNITMYCLSLIEANGFIIQKHHRIKGVGSFDTTEFDRKRESYRDIETALIYAVQEFVKRYEKDWDFEYAREQLINVLDRNGLAYDIFMHRDLGQYDWLTASNSYDMFCKMTPGKDATILIGDIEEQPLYSDEFFVGRFIQQTISTDSSKKDYLQRICEGLMLCEGAFQMPSLEAYNATPQINNTEFYFDTRLLLRYVGCAGEAAVEGAKELVKLIQDKGGKIYYYPQTLEEMKRAFERAIANLETNSLPIDDEMRIYMNLQRNNILVLQTKKASLEMELSRSGIFLRPHDTFSDSDCLQLSFNKSDLEQFMNDNLKWDKQVIENDVYSLWETHMRRRGDYSEYCGTTSKLPVFVTTNSRLIRILLEYRNARPLCREIGQWKQNRLPVITDIQLMCRLWVPSEHLKRLALLNLTANAVAAQRPTHKYLETIRNYVVQLEKAVPAYAGIPLPEFFDDNVTNAILERTRANEDNFNLGTIASSLTEVSEWKVRDQEKITEQVRCELNEVLEESRIQKQSIIDGAVRENADKLGLLRVVIYMALYWNIFTTILLAGISGTISYLAGDYKPLWIILVPMILAGIEAISSEKFIKKAITRFAFPRIDASFDKRIIKSLRNSEMPYKDEIIEQVKRKTRLWIKFVCFKDE